MTKCQYFSFIACSPSFFVFSTFISMTDQNLYSHWLSIVPLQKTYGEQYVWNIVTQYNHSMNCITYRIVRIAIRILSALKYRDNIVSWGHWQFPALLKTVYTTSIMPMEKNRNVYQVINLQWLLWCVTAYLLFFTHRNYIESYLNQDVGLQCPTVQLRSTP